MARQATLPEGLTEDQRQWIHWRMDWLCENFGEGLLENAKVAIPNGSQFPKLHSREKLGADESAELALDYLKQLCPWLDCDSSALQLAISPNPQRWSEPGEIAIDSVALSDRLNLLALLTHELAFAQLLEHTDVKPDSEDAEGLADLTAVFFGLGIVLASALPQLEGDRYFEICLSPAMLSYSLALFAEQRGETKPTWVGELQSELVEGFYDAQYYLEQTFADREASYDSQGTEIVDPVGEIESVEDEDDLTSIETEESDGWSEADARASNEAESDRARLKAEDAQEHSDPELEGRDDEIIDADPEEGSDAEISRARLQKSSTSSAKCPTCGKLKSMDSELCVECLEKQAGQQAAFRDELAKHDEANLVWLQFGLVLILALLVLVAYKYI